MGSAVLMREIKDLYRFFRRTPSERRAVLFYSEHEGYYPYLEGIVDALTEWHRVAICYISSDASDPVFETTKDNLLPFYINRFLPLFMMIVKCRVFLMTLTDLNQFHLKRSFHPVHYVYVFHSLVSTHMIYRDGAFDHYDTILCAGPHHSEEIRKREAQRGLPSKQLIEAGYYRVERISSRYRRWRDEHKGSDRKTVLVAPSWGKENVIEACGERLVGLLLDAGYSVILRPHPETLKRAPQIVAALARRYERNEFFLLERSVATDDSLLKADVLITDWSGIAFEYAFGTERPVLFMDVPRKVTNQQYAELGMTPLEDHSRAVIGKIVPPSSLELVPTVVAELCASREVYKDRIAAFRDQYVYAFGKASDIGAQYVVDRMSRSGGTEASKG